MYCGSPDGACPRAGIPPSGSAYPPADAPAQRSCLGVASSPRHAGRGASQPCSIQGSSDRKPEAREDRGQSEGNTAMAEVSISAFEENERRTGESAMRARRSVRAPVAPLHNKTDTCRADAPFASATLRRGIRMLLTPSICACSHARGSPVVECVAHEPDRGVAHHVAIRGGRDAAQGHPRAASGPLRTSSLLQVRRPRQSALQDKLREQDVAMHVLVSPCTFPSPERSRTQDAPPSHGC